MWVKLKELKGKGKESWWMDGELLKERRVGEGKESRWSNKRVGEVIRELVKERGVGEV